MESCHNIKSRHNAKFSHDTESCYNCNADSQNNINPRSKAQIKLTTFKTCNIKSSVMLAQTDTTAGFLSKDSVSINSKKGAPMDKPLLMEVASLSAIGHRIPTAMRNLVRRSSRTSYILPNSVSFRVVVAGLHRDFLRGFTWLYSSSANPSKDTFSMQFALSKSDIIVLDERGLFATKSSNIFKLGRSRIKKVR